MSLKVLARLLEEELEEFKRLPATEENFRKIIYAIQHISSKVNDKMWKNFCEEELHEAYIYNNYLGELMFILLRNFEELL